MIGAIGTVIWSLIMLPLVIGLVVALPRAGGNIVGGPAGFLFFASLLTLIGWGIYRLTPTGRAHSQRFQTVLVLACAGMGAALIIGGLASIGSNGWGSLPGILVGLVLAVAPYVCQRRKVGKLQAMAKDHPQA